MPLLPEQLRRWFFFALWFLPTGAVSVFGLFWLAHRNYPYGLDHCCDLQLGTALKNYAAAHDGHYPSGGPTPEASLSLLYPDYLAADVLRGKTYSESAARQLLEAGQPLTPETCGWQYVDGLTMQDAIGDRVALFWDKFGSDHFSGYLPHGGHSVTFMNGSRRIVKEAHWQRFLAEQETAWAAIRHGETPPPPWVPEGF